MEYFILRFHSVLQFLMTISWVVDGVCWLTTFITFLTTYDFDVEEYWKDKKIKIVIYGAMTIASILISCIYLFLYSEVG